MKRVLILGPGGSGKSILALRLGEITGLRVVELDKVFWQPGLAASAAPSMGGGPALLRNLPGFLHWHELKAKGVGLRP